LDLPPAGQLKHLPPLRARVVGTAGILVEGGNHGVTGAAGEHLEVPLLALARLING